LEQLKTHAYCDDPDVVLCGNKADAYERRVVSEERARQEAEKYGLKYFETSAATGQNVSKSMETLLDLVMSRMQRVVETSPQLPNRYYLNDNIKLETNAQNHENQTSYYSKYCNC